VKIKIIYILLLYYVFYGCNTEAKAPFLKLETDIINLGNIISNDTLKVRFKIFNTGNDTLRILKLGTSCGCTDGYVHKKILLPNDSSLVSLNYSPILDRDSIVKSIIIENNSLEPFKLVRLVGFKKGGF